MFRTLSLGLAAILSLSTAIPADAALFDGTAAPAIEVPEASGMGELFARRGGSDDNDDGGDDSRSRSDDDDDDDGHRGRGRGRGGRGGDRNDDRNDDGDGSGRDRPRIPGGSGCDDAGDIAEHPECRG